MTKRVNVRNGQLILDPTGGTQDKIDFVDAVPAAPTPPHRSSGWRSPARQTGGAGSPYASAVTVTASATDTVGVTGISYTLDGGASTPYTAPFKVEQVGDHTVVVTAVDAAANAGTATSTFTIASLLPTQRARQLPAGAARSRPATPPTPASRSTAPPAGPTSAATRWT